MTCNTRREVERPAERRDRIVDAVEGELNRLKILHARSRASVLLEQLAEREYDQWTERWCLANHKPLEWPPYADLSEEDKDTNRRWAREGLTHLIGYLRDTFWEGEGL